MKRMCGLDYLRIILHKSCAFVKAPWALLGN